VSYEDVKVRQGLGAEGIIRLMHR